MITGGGASPAVIFTASQRFDPRVYGAKGDGVTNDVAAFAAAFAAMQAGDTLDLAGLTYNVGSTVSVNVAGITVQNGTITCTVPGTPAVQVLAANVTFRWVDVNASYAFGTNWTIASTLLSALVVNAAAFVSYDCNYAGGFLACVCFSHGNCNGSKIIRGSTTQNNLAQNSCGISAAAGSVGNFDITIEDVDVIGAGGAYNSGQPAAANGIMIFDGNRCKVRNCRVRNCTRMPTLTISNGNGTSHGSTALWTLVSGTTWQARLASGTPGVSGPTYDRPDGATRELKLNGTQVGEDETTPGAPGAGKWGESGGFVYYNTSGSGFTDPNNEAFTSDTTSGYGITFYNTGNGFTDPSDNAAEGNEVWNCDGYGIYMQQGNGNGTAGTYSYGTGNRTVNNNLVNTCLQGSQDITLGYGAIGWNGGVDSLSSGDTIRNTGAAVNVPGVNIIQGSGIYLSSGRVVGVLVDGLFTQGFSHNADGGWAYESCIARGTASHGFFVFTQANQTIRNVTFTGCHTISAGASGIYFNGTAGSSLLTDCSIVGGSHRLAANGSIRLDAARDVNISGVASYGIGQGASGQAHVRFTSNCTRCNASNCHFDGGNSGPVGMQVDAGCTDCGVGPNYVVGLTTNYSLGANVVVRLSGQGGGPLDLMGSGVPTSGGNNVTAPIGSTYRNTTGAAGTCFYVNQTGLPAGWLALA